MNQHDRLMASAALMGLRLLLQESPKPLSKAEIFSGLVGVTIQHGLSKSADGQQRRTLKAFEEHGLVIVTRQSSGPGVRGKLPNLYAGVAEKIGPILLDSTLDGMGAILWSRKGRFDLSGHAPIQDTQEEEAEEPSDEDSQPFTSDIDEPEEFSMQEAMVTALTLLKASCESLVQIRKDIAQIQAKMDALQEAWK